jgi:hypothetical protein
MFQRLGGALDLDRWQRSSVRNSHDVDISKDGDFTKQKYGFIHFFMHLTPTKGHVQICPGKTGIYPGTVIS